MGAGGQASCERSSRRGPSPPSPRSEAERRLLELIDAAALPTPFVNTWVAWYEVDLFWPEQHLVVEVDGYGFHRTRQAFERDAARDADLDDVDIRVLRVTWNQLERQPARVVERLRRALRAGSPGTRAP